MPPPYNLEASWKEGNFRSSLLGQLHSSAKDRREKLKAGQRPALAGGGVSVTGDKLAERLSGEK